MKVDRTADNPKFKDSWFQLARNDRDILIVSNKYTEELRGLPNTKLSAIQALISVCAPADHRLK